LLLQWFSVGGPLEQSCRLEGLLDTVISRGKDLQRELEENYHIEEALRREIEAELQVEPNHPVVTEAHISSEYVSPSHSKDAAEPTTPKDGKIEDLKACMQTPHESPSAVQNQLRKSADIQNFEFGQFPYSPNSMDSNEFNTPGLPSYRTRQASSFDESIFDYGCGVAILGNGAARLFASSAVPPHENALAEVAHSNVYGNNHRFRSISSDAHPDLGPTLSNSFDAIDFRTGMSGHRGLNNAKMNPGHSPTPRGSRLMMSEHRGIGRVRGPLQRLSASNEPSS
jgi:hypothetical protein